PLRPAGHVRGQEVRRELDAAEPDPERLRERVRQRRLPDTRHVLEEHVPAREQRRQREAHDLALSVEDGLHLLDQVIQELERRTSIGEARGRGRIGHQQVVEEGSAPRPSRPPRERGGPRRPRRGPDPVDLDPCPPPVRSGFTAPRSEGRADPWTEEKKYNTRAGKRFSSDPPPGRGARLTPTGSIR